MMSGLLMITPGVGFQTGVNVQVPSAVQSLVAASTILANAGVVQISSAGIITLTSAPTIANGFDGQIIVVLNTGAFNITLQDQGTLANSNLRLTAAGVALTPRDSIVLMYSATVGDWVQIGSLVAVL